MSTRKKIAIFHNLNPGGAIEYNNEILQELMKIGYEIDLYTLKNPTTSEKKIYKNIYIFPFIQPEKLFSFLYLYPIYIKKIKEIAKEINNDDYGLILINHCTISQTPPIFEFLSEKTLDKTIYIYHELKREFYEKVSFDHYRPNRTIARLLRNFQKFSEQKNIKLCRHVVSNSEYSKNRLLQLLGKESTFIPCWEHFKTTSKKTGKGFLSIGTSGYTKGHWLTEEILENSNVIVDIISEKTNNPGDTEHIHWIGYKNKKQCQKALAKSKYYFANNVNEPLGLMTIEALINKNIVFANNTGANEELIKPGLNGFLYPVDNIKITRKILRRRPTTLSPYLSCRYNWKRYVDELLKITK